MRTLFAESASMRWSVLLPFAFAMLTAGAAEARGPYVVLHDDGTLSGKVTDPYTVADALVAQYKKQGAALPDVMSVWTTFPMDKNTTETLFVPESNDVKGIGLDKEYPGDGTFASDHPPIRSLLLHNDVLALADRATKQSAPVDGFAQYLFLLELMHNWGPAARVPAADGGSGADALIGFPFHWSFWMDAGGSPAGGNKWKDNGDGTFTALPQKPSEVAYSKLDLYLMGLADASEVAPFGVLENAVPPATPTDPFTGKALAASSFPWFGSAPITVTATRRTITIDDVVATNGTRMPAASASPKSFKLGIALVVAANATDKDVAAAEAVFDPIAASLAPAFARATGGRAQMDVVTLAAPDVPDAGADDAGATPPSDDAPVTTTSSAGGCATAPSEPIGTPFVIAALLVIAKRFRRRRAR
jgi:hypothetical protein